MAFRALVISAWILSNSAAVKTGSEQFRVFFLPTLPQIPHGLSSLALACIQISLASPEYQDQGEDQHDPEDPHPTIIPTLHPHAVFVHKTSTGSSQRNRSPARFIVSDRLVIPRSA
jgi:hypothetical protein